MTHLQNGLDWLRRTLLYGGLTREQCRMLMPEIDEENRKSLVVIPGACALFYFVRLNLTYFHLIAPVRWTYTIAVIVFGIVALLNHFFRQRHKLVHLSAYLFLATYLGVGIVAALTPSGIQQRTTLYLVFITVAPMLFALNALELVAVILPAECIYLALIANYQSAYPVYAVNRGNSIFLSISGLLLGIYLSNKKVSGIYSAYLTLRMDEIEKLNAELRKSREELRTALDAAQQANRAKTTFLSNMSHDIRTPMNAILGFTELARHHVQDPARVQEDLDKITLSGQHLLSLINDVLDMSRIESGQMQLDPQPVQLPELLQELQTILQHSADEKQQQLRFETQDLQDPCVSADKLRLNQILLNLLSNAIKFTPQGGSISLCMTQMPTAPAGFADYGFTVRDTGIGMSQEFQAQLFEPFTREEDAVSGIQGTGLGMAITKSLVDQMHGTITVDSTVGQGTTFTVQLRFAVARAPVQAAPQSVPATVPGKHILLAEDNALNQEIAVAILQENGFIVDAVADGAAAVEAVRTAAPGQYDLVLMDVQMPVMDGYAATRAIRALPDPARASIPILAMTANAFAEDRRAALDAGMDGHLAKPLEIPRLLEAIQQALQARGSR